jgi:hypothetical protein
MKRVAIRAIAAIGIVAMLGGVAPAVAYAGTSGDANSSIDSGSGRRSNLPMKQYTFAVKGIEQKFRSAIWTAKASLSAALAQARTPGARSTAHAQFLLAIVQATTARDAALVQLGMEPADGRRSSQGELH